MAFSQVKKVPASDSGSSNGFKFLPPGNIKDFPNDPIIQGLLEELWHTNLTGFTQQALVGNTWNSINTPPPTNYYNPATATDADNTPNAAVNWIPFPGRFGTYYQPQSKPAILSDDQLLELADTGYYTDVNNKKQTFPQITQYPCTAFDGQNFPSGNSCGCVGNPTNTIPYGPYGPRGWQDEYCEWSVTRDNNGNITRIDITCENPEYWNTLWMISPTKVLELYQQTLNNPNIKMDDLVLKNLQNEVVTDPSTQRPAYNPLNIWNSGTVSTPTYGGAMHLTSTPNTLQTEIGLGASATIPRIDGNGQPISPSDIQTLLCSAQYGQYGRNSDPNIGAVVNVNTQDSYGTLANPPGLYIQLPDSFTPFTVAGATTDVSSYFKVTRKGGSVNIEGKEYTMNLHVTIEAPAGQPALYNMLVDKKPLKWAGQLMKHFNMALLLSVYGTNTQKALTCSTSPTKQWQAQPLQLFHLDIWGAMTTQTVPNPVGQSMTLLSNSTFIAPVVKPGTTYQMLATYLPYKDIKKFNYLNYPTVTFDHPGIGVEVKHAFPPFSYAVPGNSYPSQVMGIQLDVTIDKTVPPGMYSLNIQDVGQIGTGTSMPAMLRVEGNSLSN
ncbi:MAG: hypothetical protein QM731_12770 [Chitinophagaceae bacterium]